VNTPNEHAVRILKICEHKLSGHIISCNREIDPHSRSTRPKQNNAPSNQTESMSVAAQVCFHDYFHCSITGAIVDTKCHI
jgi:hypothetical protein